MVRLRKERGNFALELPTLGTGGHFGTKTDEVPWVEKAGGVERELPTEEAVLEFCTE